MIHRIPSNAGENAPLFIRLWSRLESYQVLLTSSAHLFSLVLHSSSNVSFFQRLQLIFFRVSEQCRSFSFEDCNLFDLCEGTGFGEECNCHSAPGLVRAGPLPLPWDFHALDQIEMNCCVGDHRTKARYKVTVRWALINGCLGKSAWPREMLSTSLMREYSAGSLGSGHRHDHRVRISVCCESICDELGGVATMSLVALQQ